MSSNTSWEKIISDYRILEHDFSSGPFYLSAEEIKEATKGFQKTAEREVRLLCKHDNRKSRPDVFVEHGLFLLPVKNGFYAIVQGEGYVEIPEITSELIPYHSKLRFDLLSSKIGDSEMQHVDFAFASGLIQEFLQDDQLVLTIRGRKYTPPFSFYVGEQFIETRSVQTEVDAGYESEENVALIEVKNAKTSNTITRQLYYPYRQWKLHTNKRIIPLFFERRGEEYQFWRFEFKDECRYDSIHLVESKRYKIIESMYSPFNNS